VDDLVKFFLCGIFPKGIIIEGVQDNSSTRALQNFNTRFIFLTLENNRKMISMDKLSECCIRFNVSWNPFLSWFVYKSILKCVDQFGGHQVKIAVLEQKVPAIGFSSKRVSLHRRGRYVHGGTKWFLESKDVHRDQD